MRKDQCPYSFRMPTEADGSTRYLNCVLTLGHHTRHRTASIEEEHLTYWIEWQERHIPQHNRGL